MTDRVLNSRYFGTIAFADEGVLSFPRGLPAFEAQRDWILLDDGESSVRWLQCLGEDGPALPVVAPDAVVPSYDVRIPEEDLTLIGVGQGADPVLLIVLSIPEVAPWEMTADLRAPIVVNPDTRRAVQAIALDEKYPVRHPVLSGDLREAMRFRYVRRVPIPQKTEGQGC